MTRPWPFSDPPNVATFTSRQIVRGSDWIAYVSHDADDGAWQFHAKRGPAGEDDAMVVSLKSIVEQDPSIERLAALPLGWCAWRNRPEDDWRVGPQAASG